MNVRLATIGDFVEPVATWNPATKPADTFSYVDLSAVDQTDKNIISSASVRGSEAPSRARQLIKYGDILVSTVRPNLNGVAAVTEEFNGATASTGFCVLRPRSEKLSSRYLFHWVRSPQFVDAMVRQATGASYPAISDRIVKASPILLLPLDEQRRIAAILDKADELRRKRKSMLELIDELSAGLFRKTFVEGDKGSWPSTTVAEVALNVRTGPFGSQLLHSEFVDTGIAVLGIDNAVENEFRWAQRRFISEKKYAELNRYTVLPGDVIITIMGTCGRCAVVPEDIPTAINTKHLCCITLDRTKCLPEFLKAVFLQHPVVLKQLGIQAKGAVMPGLNMGIIKSLSFPLPPLDAQAAFAQSISALEDARTRLRKASTELELLFSSLQHRAFSGQL